MTRIDQNSAITKIYAYEIKQNLSQNIFCCKDASMMALRTVFFPYYHSQRLLFSPTKNNFSTTLTPTERYILKSLL